MDIKTGIPVTGQRVYLDRARNPIREGSWATVKNYLLAACMEGHEPPFDVGHVPAKPTGVAESMAHAHKIRQSLPEVTDARWDTPVYAHRRHQPVASGRSGTWDAAAMVAAVLALLMCWNPIGALCGALGVYIAIRGGRGPFAIIGGMIGGAVLLPWVLILFAFLLFATA